MAATVRGTIRELLEQTMVTMDALLDASDGELSMPSSHACAHGKDAWTLITNDIDHEKIHTGQVVEGRHEARLTPSPMERLIAEWLAERARFPGRPDRRAVQPGDGSGPVDLPRGGQTRARGGAGLAEDDGRRPRGPRERRVIQRRTPTRPEG
jgi:hypothetical protein